MTSKTLLRLRGVLALSGALVVAGCAKLAHVFGLFEQFTPLDQAALAVCVVVMLGCLGVFGGDGASSIGGWFDGDGESSDCGSDGGGD